MRFFLELFSSRRPVKHGLVYGYLLQGNILVVGKYEQEQVFAGTDRLSMAVQPDFDIVLESRQYNLMFEGDRLFIEKNLQKLCEQYDTRIIMLSASENELRQRHAQRADDQSDTFLKSRQTKIANIMKNELIKSHTETYELQTIAQATALSQDMHRWIMGKDGKG